MAFLTGSLFAGTNAALSEDKETPHVVFVHGIFDQGSDFKRFAKFSAELGWSGHTPSLRRGDGRATMSELAEQLDEFITQNLPADALFHLVGHSMGGIVCKQYIIDHSTATRVQTLTTLGSPHHGSGWARLLPLAGARELRPSSTLLADQRNHQWAIPILNIYTPLDLVVMKWRSGWEGTVNHRSLVPAHPLLIRTRGNFERIATHVRSFM